MSAEKVIPTRSCHMTRVAVLSCCCCTQGAENARSILSTDASRHSIRIEACFQTVGQDTGHTCSLPLRVCCIATTIITLHWCLVTPAANCQIAKRTQAAAEWHAMHHTGSDVRESTRHFCPTSYFQSSGRFQGILTALLCDCIALFPWSLSASPVCECENLQSSIGACRWGSAWGS